MRVHPLKGGDAEFTSAAPEFEGAWDGVFSGWLPNSGYRPDDRPRFEVYRGDPTVDAKPGVSRCDICLPVRLL